MVYTQENRLIAVETPLGKDVLLLTGFAGKEGLSIPFNFELSLVSVNHSITFKDIIGKKVAVSITLPDGDKRFYHGYVSRFSQGRGGGEAEGDPCFSYYTATLVPWLWLLTRTADSRIFQKLSVPDIVEKIFGEKGFSHYKMLLNGSYEKRDYCVQYRETDFDFVSRLLEDEGIFYFFRHEKDKHTMVLADIPDEHKPCPKQKTARYQISAGGRLEEDVITGLEWMQEIQAGKYTLNSFNFEMPGTDLKVDVATKQMLGPGESEIYDYPGLYTKKARGERLTTIRMEEEEAKITTIIGSSECRAFASGYRFTLLEYYRQDMNEKDYVLTSVDHKASQEIVPGGTEPELSYINNFTCIPFDVPYRPPRNTPKPTVQGTQTAIVVGPSGEEIYTDEHSRVKVQFHWDREGKKDENSSCWIRVSQLWAGAGWGAVYIPRIGHEVIVDFLEGDPDRPIITGRVYHGSNKPPYELPGEKTKSTIKSDSSLGGGGSNEFRFEDKKGEEEIYLHGQKDWTIAIENDKNQTVGHDESLSVGNNRTKTIGGDQSESIGSNKSIQVGADHTENIGTNMFLSVGADRSKSIGANETITVTGNRREKVNGTHTETIRGNTGIRITQGNYTHDVVRGSARYHVEEDLTERYDRIQEVIVGDRFELRCGAGKIIVAKTGKITIQGTEFDFRCSGPVKMRGSVIDFNEPVSLKDEAYREPIRHFPPVPPLSPEKNLQIKNAILTGHKSKESFAGKDFAGADLSNMDLKGIDMRNASLEGANLSGADLSSADLTGAVLAKSDLSGARFVEARMDEADLSEARLCGTDFTGASANKARFMACDLTGATLTRANMRESLFLKATVNETDFSTANSAGMGEARPGQANLAGPDLSGADLTKAVLAKSNFSGARFIEARMDEADLSEARLCGTDFTRASVNKARFIESDLTGATFTETDIKESLFFKATVQETDFSTANTDGAVFVGVKGAAK